MSRQPLWSDRRKYRLNGTPGPEDNNGQGYTLAEALAQVKIQIAWLTDGTSHRVSKRGHIWRIERENKKPFECWIEVMDANA